MTESTANQANVTFYEKQSEEFIGPWRCRHCEAELGQFWLIKERFYDKIGPMLSYRGVLKFGGHPDPLYIISVDTFMEAWCGECNTLNKLSLEDWLTVFPGPESGGNNKMPIEHENQ